MLAQGEGAAIVLPAEAPPAAKAWAEAWMGMDYNALFQSAKAQAKNPRPQAQIASNVPLDIVTGPFLFLSESGIMSEKANSYSDVFNKLFWTEDRWEDIASTDASPIFMVAERQADRVIGNYSLGAKVSVSIYRMYIIDGEGNLLGWEEIASIGNAPNVLKSSDPRFFDQNPYPGFLDTMRYDKDAMLINEDGVITAYRSNMPAELIIPEGVTAILAEMFKGQNDLHRVVFPSSLRKIGKSAFEGCNNLAEIVFAEGLTEIAPMAFRDCGALTSVVFPTTLRQIGYNTFDNCKSLKQVVLNEGLETIEASAFESTKIDNLFLPDSLLVIGMRAFADCASLQAIDFGIGKPRIDRNAFINTPWMDTQETE